MKCIFPVEISNLVDPKKFQWFQRVTSGNKQTNKHANKQQKRILCGLVYLFSFPNLHPNNFPSFFSPFSIFLAPFFLVTKNFLVKSIKEHPALDLPVTPLLPTYSGFAVSFISFPFHILLPTSSCNATKVP